MHIAFVVSRLLDDTRALVRAVSGGRGIRVSLLKGDSDARSALRVLRGCDRIWFEGAGPLLAALAARPSAAHLPKAVLRLPDDGAGGPAAPGLWQVVAEVVLGSAGCAQRFREAADPPAGVRLSVTGGLDELLAALARPAGGLSDADWSAILQVGQAARGRVVIQGDAPPDLAEYLSAARGLAIVGQGPAETVVTWRRGRGLAPPQVQVARAAQGRGSPTAPALCPSAGPRITCVIPVYNDADRIERAVLSARRQTYSNLDILVIDDGSTDGTRQRVAPHLADPRVQYLYTDHVGQCGARNLGVRHARGEYILWQDSDDEAEPNRAAVMAGAAQADPQADILFSDGFLLDRQGRFLERRRYRDFAPEDVPWLLFRSLTGICPILHTSVMAKRGFFERVGLYDPAYVRCEDYDLWARGAVAGARFRHVAAPLVKVYRAPPRQEDLHAALEGYVRLFRRLAGANGEGVLLDPVARDLQEPPCLAIGRQWLSAAIVMDAPPEHPALGEAEAYLKRALEDPAGDGHEEAAALLGALQQRRGTERRVPLDRLLLGQEAGIPGETYARIVGDPMRASTPLARSPHVDLLRQYVARGEEVFEPEAFARTAYCRSALRCIGVRGHYFGARSAEEVRPIARDFVRRLDPGAGDAPTPARRPGQTACGDPILVRPVLKSDCYEIVDGHHRLAIACVRGEKEATVRCVGRGTLTPLQRLLLEVRQVRQGELYQPIDAPELRGRWQVVRRCTDRLEMMAGFLRARGLVPPAARTYLDIASSYGWFLAEMGKLGFQARGVEVDAAAAAVGPLVYGLRPDQTAVADAVAFLRGGGRYDVVSCFSILHHFALGKGTARPEELLRLVDQATGRVLFFDTGQNHEAWFRQALPEWDADYVEAYLRRHTSFAEVLRLGLDRDNVPPYEANYGRTLFACVR
jgi:hypothetical protein